MSGPVTGIAALEREAGVRKACSFCGSLRVDHVEGEGSDPLSGAGFLQLAFPRPVGISFERVQTISKVEDRLGDQASVSDGGSDALGTRPTGVERGAAGFQGFKEADGGLLPDELGRALVEVGLAGQEGGGMNEFVEEGFDQSARPPPEHRSCDGVIEPTERRVGRDAAHAHVVAAVATQPVCLLLCRPSVEISLIGK